MSRIPRKAGSVLLVALSLATVRSRAQDSAQSERDQLRGIHAVLMGDLSRPLAPEKAQDALEKMSSWHIQESRLPAEDKRRFYQTVIIAHLAVGDARSATDYLAELQKLGPADKASAELAYLTTCAAGDAQACSAAIKKLAEIGVDKAVTTERARRLRLVATRIAEASVKTVEGEEVALRHRLGKALFLYLWNIRKKPSDAQVEAMRTNFQQFGQEGDVEFLTVSADPAASTGDAIAFMKSARMKWKHHFEEKGAGAPVTHKLLKAGGDPLQYLIDADGFIRAAGDPADLGQIYAARALAAESAGKFKSAGMLTVDGKPPKDDADAPPAGKGGKSAASGKDKSPDRSPDKSAKQGKKADKDGGKTGQDGDEEKSADTAESLLNRARLFWRTGKKNEARELFRRIVQEFPNTPQAKDAQSYLDVPP